MISTSKKLWIKEYYFTYTGKDFTAFVSAGGNHYWNQEESIFKKITFFLLMEITGNQIFKK